MHVSELVQAPLLIESKGQLSCRRHVGDQHVNVYAHCSIGCDKSQLPRDPRSPVAPLRAKAVVPEATHQLRPGMSNAADVPPCLSRRPREAIAGN